MDLHNKTRSLLIEFVSGIGIYSKERSFDDVFDALKENHPNFKPLHPENYTYESIDDLAKHGLMNAPDKIIIKTVEYFLSDHFYLNKIDLLEKDVESLNSLLTINNYSINKINNKYKILINKIDRNDALYIIADDAREDVKAKKYKSFRDAYKDYASMYTYNGKEFTAMQLERSFHKARADSRVD